MSNVSDAEMQRFVQRFQAGATRAGRGKIEIDSKALRDLVRGARGAAERFVQLYCVLAESNPAMFQGAMLVAVAYLIEFGDDRLVEAVEDKARANGALEWIKKIGLRQS